ncbi:MAG: RagB/SusD family nutrient uptake outer membrane protein [Prevotella sp.]|nr:RagB/SusD family nutrient uptake outer membrane protein [Prevotella sp.]MBR2035642.1 RagB/SusD family nutrient uptake outer membrane protein [Prevotella sp.]
MKKIIIAIAAVLGLGSVTSCSDMLETESSRQMFEPELSDKTDSTFYAFGIAQAMQQLADQYVFQGELRGDLIATTYNTDKNLRELADYSATTANKYDSAYVYYRVINNCNYYIAHRDTTLLTGAEQVVMKEYAAVKAFRAWAYLQLAKNYGRVPFFTVPLTKISQIDEGNFPEYGLNEIVAQLAPDLAQYSGMQVPMTGQSYGVGTTNWGEAKDITTKYLFIPVDVVLGEMYLETGNYAQAAHYYTLYITKLADKTSIGDSYTQPMMRTFYVNDLPADFTSGTVGSNLSWSSIFSLPTANGNLISYIPMAVNRLNGTTTNVPMAFGYDYYSTDDSRECPKADDVQLQPSDYYVALSDSSDYYYISDTDKDGRTLGIAKIGDARLGAITENGTGDDSTKVWMNKFNNGNIILYRNTAIWLRLAEAFNRLGYYDAAFAILKDGMSENLLEFAAYIKDETKTMLTTTYPLLSDENISLWPLLNKGIHGAGSGNVADITSAGYFPGISPYQLDTIVGMKMKEIAEKYNVAVGTTKEDTINAVEDLISDEYALEMAFEGDRFGNLTRMARNKNRAGLYGANFGGIWFAKKLEKNNPVKDLSVEQNWYLPFK